MRSARGLYLVQALLFLAASTSTIRVENNRYKDVVVSISPNVQSEGSQEIVENLKYVLVLDTSESMNELERLSRLKRIATDWLLYYLPRNKTVKVGIVTFNFEATQITNGLVEDVNELVNTINGLRAGGRANKADGILKGRDMLDGPGRGANIDDGILKGIDMLDGPNNQDKGGVMILFTDKNNNLGLNISESYLVDKIRQQNMKIVTLALDYWQSDKLKNFVAMTGGKCYITWDYSYSDHFSETFQSNVTPSKVRAVKSISIWLPDNSTTFYIDETIGKDVQVILNVYDQSEAEKIRSFRVTFPNGSVVEQPVVNITTTLFFDFLPVGQFIAELTHKGDLWSFPYITVISNPKNDQPITVETSYYVQESNFVGVNKDGRRVQYRGWVYAYVKFGRYDLSGATVECYYRNDTEVPKMLILNEDPGYYYSWIEMPVRDGGFSVMCQVKGDGGTSFLDYKGKAIR